MTEPAAYRLAPDVAFVEGDGDEVVVYAARLPGGPPVILREASAVIWVEACNGGSIDEIVERTAEDVGREPDEIRDDVTAFLRELVDVGLLVADTQEPASS